MRSEVRHECIAAALSSGLVLGRTRVGPLLQLNSSFPEYVSFPPTRQINSVLIQRVRAV